MRQIPRVALLIETSNDYARSLLRGIIAYIREHRPWSIYLSELGRGQEPPPWLTTWRGDGIIARIENEGIAQVVRSRNLPTVDLSAARLVPDLPWVETDDDAIAILAAEHLLERGFRQFAFCGDPRFQWSSWRQEAFVRAVGNAGHACQVFPGEGGERDELRLAAWVRRLPKPIGVMAAYDQRGRQVIDACREAQVPVPDEVAVIGVDNDDLICELCDPPMSSVQPHGKRTGYAAAEMLATLLAGKDLPVRAQRIAPQGVVTRPSSDVLATADPELVAALRHIRDHACDGLDVNELLATSALSRRVLERRFLALLGHTPHEQILRVRFARVKSLLLETDLPLAVIAERAGFAHVEYLTVAFKKRFGLTPSAFRRR
jgi:LacI family transcriptional regulator